MTISIAIALTGALIFLAHLFVALFRRTRVPDALLLILIGILLGPVFGWVRPDHLGKVGPTFSMLALAVILFEGGLETHLAVLRAHWRAALFLILPAYAATMAGSGYLVRLATGMEWHSALLMGAIVASASPSIIVPMARHLEMRSGPQLVLTLETAISDVLCVVLVLGFVQAHKDGAFDAAALARDLAVSFGLSAAVGCLAGLGWSLLLNRIRSIRNNIFLTLALVLVLFGSLEIMHLSGGIAVLCFGGAITNSGGLNASRLAVGRFGRATPFTEREKAFFSEAVFLLKTFFFVYLGLSLRFGNAGVLLLASAMAALKILVRIPLLSVSLPRGETRRDASLMSVMISLGLASAVLASLPLQEGLDNGALIRDLTYSVILASILANSVLVFLLDRTPAGNYYGRLFGRFAATAKAEAPGPEAGGPGAEEAEAQDEAPAGDGLKSVKEAEGAERIN